MPNLHKPCRAKNPHVCRYHGTPANSDSNGSNANNVANTRSENTQPQPARLDDIAPLCAFNNAVQAKLVRTQTHPNPDVPYLIYDYTEQATYDKHWDEVTLNSRGLIINRETREIVARPFPKFFNDNEHVPGLNDFDRTGEVLVADKADGSMGILYQLPDETWAISTRGSMNSEQAQHATALYNERYAGAWTPRSDLTYCFEIIYPSNRVVLDNGDMDDIVLLGAVEKKTGRSLPFHEAARDWPGLKVEQLSFTSYSEALSTPIPDDREGYVLHFVDSDKRVKLKGAEYLRLHKIVTNLTPLRVWENLEAGTGKDWLQGIPEEYVQQIEERAAVYQKQYDDIVSNYRARVAEVRAKWTDGDRKTIIQMLADRSTDKRDFQWLIAFLDGRESTHEKFQRSIWLHIRPDGRERFE